MPAITKVTANLASFTEEARQWVTLKPAMSEAGSREIFFELPGPMPIDRARILFSDPGVLVRVAIFSRGSVRDKWRQQASGIAYLLHSGDSDILSPEFRLNMTTDRFWLLRFQGTGNYGTKPPVVEVGYVPQRVIFAPRGTKPFFIAYGSGKRIVPREDALLAVADQRKEEIAEAKTGAQRVMGGTKRLRDRLYIADWKAAVLWVVLVVGVGILAWMARRLYLQMK
jgi:hypothetical protein